MAVVSWSSLSSNAPARPTPTVLLAATAVACAALLSLVGIGALSGHLLLIPSMAASMALIAGVPTLPLSQPRNVIGGQTISALVGVSVGTVSHSLWAAALAGGLAFGAMLLTRTPHSPAAATAVIGTLLVDGQWSFVACAACAATVLVAWGAVQSRLGGTTYPAYWW